VTAQLKSLEYSKNSSKISSTKSQKKLSLAMIEKKNLNFSGLDIFLFSFLDFLEPIGLTCCFNERKLVFYKMLKNNFTVKMNLSNFIKNQLILSKMNSILFTDEQIELIENEVIKNVASNELEGK
jgi:hypothetical protein